jgi:hypothetical protein
MSPTETLHEEIRAMAADCSVCERDARDAEGRLGISLDLDAIAHPEDAFAFDLIPHRRERHRDRMLKKIEQWLSMAQRRC